MSVTLEMLQQAAVTRENEMLNHQVKENEANKTPQNCKPSQIKSIKNALFKPKLLINL